MWSNKSNQTNQVAINLKQEPESKVHINNRNNYNQETLYDKTTDTTQESSTNNANSLLLSNISEILVSLIKTTCKNLTNIKSKLKLFFQKKVPKMSIDKYLMRIYKFSGMHTNTVILSLILVDRFCEKVSLDLTGNTIYKILLVAALIAYKANEDIIYNNKNFARIGGVNLEEMNNLEIAFLEIIKYEVYVKIYDFSMYYDMIASI